MSDINSLTPEQQALIPIYREKWRNIALSTTRVDRTQSIEAIKAVYKFLGYTEPEILFFDSTKSIAKNIQRLLEERITNLSKPIKEPLFKTIGNKLGKPFFFIIQALYRELCVEIGGDYFALSRIALDLDLYKNGTFLYQMYSYIKHDLYLRIKKELSFSNYELKFISEDKLKHKLSKKISDNVFTLFGYVNDCLLVDYCHTILNSQCNLTLWNIVKALCIDSGLIIIPFQSICLVCDRPMQILLDNQNYLHGEGEAAIEYADGFKFYIHHGLALPEKYGSVHPSEWKDEWLSTETDPKIKDILRKEINSRKNNI